MRKVAAAALAMSVITAACSGHNGSSLPPAGGSGSSPSALGVHSTRSAAAVTAPPGWATTATQVFSLTNASDLGALSSSQTMTVRLGLQLHNVDGLKSIVASGQTISPGAFNAQYAPTASDVQAVTSYLQSKGLTGITVEPNNVIVSATGTAAQVSAAFDTTLHSFTQNGATVYANTKPAFVPSNLGNIVVAIMGLNNAQTFKTSPKKGSAQPAPTPKPTPTAQPETPCDVYSLDIVGLPSPQPEPSPVSGAVGCLRNYTPSDYWRAYDAMNVAAASGVSVAVMAEGNVAQSVSDLRTNEQGDGLQTVPVVVKQVGVASTDTAGDDEWTLDMTASSGMARVVKTIYLYDTTSLTDSDIALEFNRFVTDDLAKVGNASFGGCEYGPYVDGSMLVDDEILLEGAAQGQTLFASSGDTGSFCSVGNPNGVPGGLPLVEYPAASPYTVAVGGTTLASMSDGSYQGEAGWTAGGGGVSQFEYSPVWQQSVQPADATGAAGFRGVPDIAMDADLQTGMMLYITGTGWTTIGGTSLASPLAAGAWARMLQVHPTLGFAASQLYKEYTANTAGANTSVEPVTRPVGGFHDILIGANGAFTALPGYDYITGLGSLDVGVTSQKL
ncbi:MAG: S8 family serine peptidase [Candidatus Eremiobacteraeota bacterium]|nr:S8 family serine peptidase [Candidatus Eremiobacteraeota bacterium]